MIDKIVSMGLNTLPEGFTKETIGSYNVAPTGWTEISEAEFCKSGFFTWSPSYQEYRQLYRDIDGNTFDKYISVKMYYMWNSQGFAISADYWAGKLRFFRFGCDHEYGAPMTDSDWNSPGVDKHFRGMCCHTEKCKKCGHIWQYDSSD